MGIVDRIAGRRAYLDVNVFIYALEAHPEYVTIVEELFTAVDAGIVRAVTSELSLAEALVKPFMDGREDLQATYLAAISPAPHLDVRAVNRETLVEAARIRGTRKVRLPDAIHLATARLDGCGVFLTNDFGVVAVPGMEVLLLSDFVGG